MKPDVLDFKILSLLDENARATPSALAKQLGISKERVNYRIKRLESSKIIKSFYPFIDPTKIGLHLYRLYIVLHSTTGQKEGEIKKFFFEKTPLVWLDDCEGMHELVVTLAADRIQTIRQTILEIKEKFGNYISTKEKHIIAGIDRYCYGYPAKTPKIEQMQLDFPEAQPIDSLDRKLLRLLVQNPRQTLVDLAQKTGLTPNAVNYRIKKLEEKKIVLGYGTQLNPSSLNLLPLSIHISLRDLNDTPKVKEFFRKNATLVFAFDLIGKYDLSVDVLVTDINAYRKLLKKFKETFVGIYNHYTVSTIMERNFFGFYPAQELEKTVGNPTEPNKK